VDKLLLGDLRTLLQLEDVSMDSLLQLVEEISEVGGIDLSRVLPKKAWSWIGSTCTAVNQLDAFKNQV